MLDYININWQSSVCIRTKSATVYFDPWKLEEELHDADIICISHNHFDHFSLEDIDKAANSNTVLVAPASIRADVTGETVICEKNCKFAEPGEIINIGDVTVETVPAYNVGKEFHKKEYGWLGYILEADGIRYYFAGDTDVNDDVKQVRCDVALLPVGGYYTMKADEAAELTNEIAPKYAIPMHFGCVDNAGTKSDDTNFASKINKNTEVVFKLHKTR
ncbi:MAG: MBL fold metallo-hydrolase [Lachnospiraceae bacterium]|nr:MBL fold metallo-hydrolase [Lachnospiraceae bacterium]